MPLKPVDVAALAALVAEITPLLEHNKFNAIRCFRKLQDLVADTSLADEIGALNAPMQNLSFDLVLTQLHSLVARPAVSNEPDGS